MHRSRGAAVRACACGKRSASGQGSSRHSRRACNHMSAVGCNCMRMYVLCMCMYVLCMCMCMYVQTRARACVGRGRSSHGPGACVACAGRVQCMCKVRVHVHVQCMRSACACGAVAPRRVAEAPSQRLGRSSRRQLEHAHLALGGECNLGRPAARGGLQLGAHRGGQRRRATGRVVEPEVDEEGDTHGDGRLGDGRLGHGRLGALRGELGRRLDGGGRRGWRGIEDAGGCAVEHATVEAQVPAHARRAGGASGDLALETVGCQ